MILRPDGFHVHDPKPPGPRRELFQGPHWYACRTRARAEKKVDRLLSRMGFEVYTPLVEREQEWADRKKRVAFPMFPSYTFVRFSLGEYLDLLKTPGVVHVVGTRGKPTPLRPEEMDSVRCLVEGLQETGQVPDPVDYLEPGVPIEVKEGAFQGMRGVVLEGAGRGPGSGAVERHPGGRERGAGPEQPAAHCLGLPGGSRPLEAGPRQQHNLTNNRLCQQ